MSDIDQMRSTRDEAAILPHVDFCVGREAPAIAALSGVPEKRARGALRDMNRRGVVNYRYSRGGWRSSVLTMSVTP